MKRLSTSLQLAIALIALMWLGFLLSYVLPIQDYGIVPRTLYGLTGIISAPFLHSSLSHISGNSISLFGLGLVFSMLGENKILLKIVLMILLGGLLTWIFARTANHIGASGLIFAIWAYILLAGWFNRQMKYIIASLVVIVLYGSMIFAIFPGEIEVSWESHLFGFLAGIYLAWYFHKKHQ